MAESDLQSPFCDYQRVAVLLHRFVDKEMSKELVRG
jgi:hypothetical protein